MLTCREAVRLISAREDRRLRWPERVGLRLHVAICVLCRRYARQIRFLSDVLRTNSGNSSLLPTARLDAEARRRIGERLK
jgi:hypothetical protein